LGEGEVGRHPCVKEGKKKEKASGNSGPMGGSWISQAQNIRTPEWKTDSHRNAQVRISKKKMAKMPAAGIPSKTMVTN